MLAGRRSEVAELNVHGRLRAELAGQLTGDPLDIGSQQFQIGDAVMTLKNDKRVGVRNGNRGVVVEVDIGARSMRVRMQRGDVDLPTRYLDAGHVGHAYAMTVNKAHGLTCDRTMTLGNDQVYRELAYEALSRGRLSNHVYMPKSCTLDIEEDGPHARTASLAEATETLDRGLRRRRTKHLALDEMATVPIEAWPTPDLHAEKRRVEQMLGAAGPGPTTGSGLPRGVARWGRSMS
jgi:ATP-dependent exoDNAse (exonuclease V) alpha subunit